MHSPCLFGLETVARAATILKLGFQTSNYWRIMTLCKENGLFLKTTQTENKNYDNNNNYDDNGGDSDNGYILDIIH